MSNEENNKWENERKLVLYRLDELKDIMERVAEKQQSMNDDMNRFRGVASVWGALSGFIVVIFAKLIDKFW